jgi:hypothetical protein
MAITDLNDEQIYYFQLGRFVIQFSKAELMVFLFSVDLLGIKKHECNAITSGAKIDGCIQYIKRIYEARGQEIPANVLECLDKLGPLNKLRNDLVHWHTDGELTVTNEVRALPGRIVTYVISSQILDDAIQDLGKATLILSNITAPFDGPDTDLAKAKAVMNGPWRYKSPSQENNRQESL